MLTLNEVFLHPEAATYYVELSDNARVVMRPLQHDDVDLLAAFLAGLSPQTRRFSTFPSYDKTMAQALCDAINRYDKLRFVVEALAPGQIVGLLEFSFDIPNGDRQRYAQHGIELDATVDCRWGPTLADDYQNVGLGSKLFAFVANVARRFGKKRIILWGGVLADNRRAIRFYEKQGFQPVGIFRDHEDELLFDMILNLVEEGAKTELST
jgi:RimJ/RimL family protein N-acetyltransferase